MHYIETDNVNYAHYFVWSGGSVRLPRRGMNRNDIYRDEEWWKGVTFIASGISNQILPTTNTWLVVVKYDKFFSSTIIYFLSFFHMISITCLSSRNYSKLQKFLTKCWLKWHSSPFLILLNTSQHLDLWIYDSLSIFGIPFKVVFDIMSHTDC